MSPTPAALLEQQDGLVASGQAERHGLSGRTLRRRAEVDGWKRVAQRVYLASGHRLSPRGRIRAAALWAGEAAVIAGPAAAFWHGMSANAPGEITVTAPRHPGLRGYPGVRVRRRDLHRDDVARWDGLRLTSRALTALETAAAVPDGSVFLDRRPSEARVVRRGVPTAALRVAAADRADSAAERLVVHLLRASGITGWCLGLPFASWTIDPAFADVRLAVEIDSWAWRVDVDGFRADRHKGNALVRAGWTLLRFTWHDLANRPVYVVARIRAALLASTA